MISYLLLGFSLGLGPLQDPTAAAPAAVATVEKPPPSIDDETRARFEAARLYAASLPTYALIIQKAGHPFVSWAPEGSRVDKGYTMLASPCCFWGLAGLLAVQDGLAESLDDKVSATIAEWKDKEFKQDITLRQLLDFSSGIDPDRAPFLGGSGGDRFILSVSLKSIGAPGKQFRYGPGSQYVFGEWMRRKLVGKNESALQYMERKVFSKIGMTPGAWATDQADNPLMAFGTNLSATEWIKYGELIKNKGKHKEEQIVDAKLIEELFKPSPVNPNHTLGFWTWTGLTVAETDQLGLMDPQFKAQSKSTFEKLAWVPRDLIFAAGAGRRLYIIPSADIVAVRMGDTKGWSDLAFLSALFQSPAKQN